MVEIILEVFFRALVLFIIGCISFLLLIPSIKEIFNEKKSYLDIRPDWFTSVVFLVTLFGAAALMTFWDRIFPDF